MKTLTLIRGVSGSGKSTFAKTLNGIHLETDMYFIDPVTGEYNWDGEKIKQAHEWCQDRVDGYGTGCGKYIQYKSEGLNDYCFSIAMENFNSPGLFTEKVVDCFLSGTIPIFYGSDDIGDYFNKQGFFQFKTLEELNNILDNINFDTYNNMKGYVIENFEKAKEYMFPEVTISNFLKNL